MNSLKSLRRAFVRLAVAVVAAAGLLLGVVTFTPLVDWWAASLAGPWSEPEGGTIIVLTGSGHEEGVLGYSSYLRAVYAAMLWENGGWQKIVISGAGMAGPVRDFLVARGTPPEAIVLEERSHSTKENALFTAELLADDDSPKLLLTSDYHMRRAARLFEKAGLEVTPWPIPDARKRATRLHLRWWAFLDLTTETAKIACQRALGEL